MIHFVNQILVQSIMIVNYVIKILVNVEKIIIIQIIHANQIVKFWYKIVSNVIKMIYLNVFNVT